MSLHEFLQDDPGCVELATGAVLAVSPMLRDPDPAKVLRQLDEWAFTLAGQMPLPWNFQAAVDALNHFLFFELGFHGDRERYEDPRNAILPSVIERRRGLPITLSILWMELARRMGFQAVGVGLPGHFVTGIRNEFGVLYFDPYYGGEAVGEERAAELVTQATSGRVSFDPSMLAPMPNRQILARLVRNLHLRFLKAELWDEALWTSTHLVLLEPESPQAHKERAFVHLHRGDEDAALEDLKAAQALTTEPDPELSSWVERLGG